MPGNFVDSNVLLYLISDDERKAMRAEAVFHQGGVISVQVLNEITNVARRKRRMAWPALRDFLDSVRDVFQIEPVNIETHEISLDIAERYQLATYDAVIAAAALQADCDVLMSEDMHDGLRIFGKLLVTNPFRTLQ